ncbi:MAG: START domain-containing protein [Flammeovirgaceae bacterium]
MAQNECKLQLDRDSIRVYNCKVPDSKFKAVKVEFQLKATYAEAAAMILDINNLHRWQYQTASATTLRKINEHELIYYTEVKTPTVINNRDFVIHLSIHQNKDSKNLTVRAVSKPDYIATKKRVVRVPFSDATWQIKSISKNRLAVTYYIQIDFGGAIPAWVVNSMSHIAPYETFKAMRNEIGRYRNQSVKGILD